MKQRKNIYLIVALLVCLMNGTLATASAQDKLNEYLSIAAENNPEVKAKFSEYLAALEVVPQVKSLPDPQVAFAYFVSPVETRMGPQQFKITASQMFPWFGTLEAKANVAAQNAKVKYEAFEAVKSKLFHEVRSTYFDLYFNQQAINIANENLKLLDAFQKMAAVKVEAGKATAVDQYRVEMELGDLQNQIAILSDRSSTLKVAFNNLLNSEVESSVEVDAELKAVEFQWTKAQLLDSVLNNNHELLMLSLQEEAFSYQKEVAEKAGKPNFSLGLDYTVIGKGENNLAGTDAFVFPMVGISIPLYRNKYKAMVNEVLNKQEAASFATSGRENVLSSMVEKTWNEYRNAERRIKLYATQTQLAKQSLQILETRYSTGETSFEELLRMERKLLNYQLESEKAIADSHVAVSFLHYLIGK